MAQNWVGPRQPRPSPGRTCQPRWNQRAPSGESDPGRDVRSSPKEAGGPSTPALPRHLGGGGGSAAPRTHAPGLFVHADDFPAQTSTTHGPGPWETRPEVSCSPARDAPRKICVPRTFSSPWDGLLDPLHCPIPGLRSENRPACAQNRSIDSQSLRLHQPPTAAALRGFSSEAPPAELPSRWDEIWVDRCAELWFRGQPLTGENHELRSDRNRRKTIPG